MPEPITEPITKTVAELGPATLPLAGTELTFVIQGGQPKQAPVSSIGVGGGGVSETYSPTLVASAGTAITRGIAGAGPLGLTTVGAGAGSTKTLFGCIGFSGASDGATIDLPLPLGADLAAAPFPLIEVISKLDTVAVITAEPTSFTNVRFTLVSDGADSGAFTFRITYQTSV